MSLEFVLLLLCRFWCSGTLFSQNGRTDNEHGVLCGWCFNSESSMVAALVGSLVPHTAHLFPFAGVPHVLWAELVTTVDAVKVMSLLQTGNLSGADWRLSHAGDSRARSKWSSPEKRLRRCYYPCKPNVVWVIPYIISGCNTCINCFRGFFCRKYTGKIMFQSDLTAHRSSFIVLNWKGRRKGLFVTSGQNPYAALHNWSLLWLVNKLWRLAAAFLSSVANLQPLKLQPFSYCH